MLKLPGWTWWIDRWRKSTAFTEMTLEEQGAYRNLLDEAWLRAIQGEGIPNEPRTLARASGDPIRWPKIQARVLRRFHLVGGAYHHETVDILLRQAQQNAAKQQSYRGRKRTVTLPSLLPQTLPARDGNNEG